MNRKKLAIFITVFMLASAFSPYIYGEEAYISDEGITEFDDFSEEEGYIDDSKAPDNTTIEYSNGVITVGGTGSCVDRRSEMVTKAGDEGNITRIVFGTGVQRAAGGLLDSERDNNLPNLEEIVFESGHALDEIGSDSFRGNTGLRKVDIQKKKDGSKTEGYEIDHNAFENCTALSDLTTNNVFHIGRWAFRNDPNIKNVDLQYLHHMRGNAFARCTGLESISVAADNPYFSIGSDGGLYKTYCPYYTEQNGLYEMVVPALVTVPYKKVGNMYKMDKGTRTIGYGALEGNLNLKEVKLVSGVKLVQDRAFFECDNLKKVYISKSVTKIGKDTFATASGNELTYYKNDSEPGNVTDIYYGGSEEEWAKISYWYFDKGVDHETVDGSVKDHMKDVGFADNVTIHYNYYDPDILVPDVIKSGSKISVSCCVIMAKSRKISFDPEYLGFTPGKGSTFTVKALDSSPAKGLKVSKKGAVKANKAGCYEVTSSNAGSDSKTTLIYVEEPKMKKLELNTDDVGTKYTIDKMLSGISFLEPEAYSSKKPAVATIDDKTGSITAVGKGTSKITVTICGKKFKANIRIKAKKK